MEKANVANVRERLTYQVQHSKNYRRKRSIRVHKIPYNTDSWLITLPLTASTKLTIQNETLKESLHCFKSWNSA